MINKYTKKNIDHQIHKKLLVRMDVFGNEYLMR